MDWNDYAAIAEALHRAYPDENYVMLSDAELTTLVLALPGFSGASAPQTPHVVSAIRAVWTELAADEPDDAAPLAD